MKKAERGVGLAVVNRDLVFFFFLIAIGDGRKIQKMKKAERGVGLAVFNRDLVFFISLIAIGDGRKIQKLKKALKRRRISGCQ